MSKSLLIVICDFLLLSLLSIANFDTPAQADAESKKKAEESAEQNFVDSQMVDLLKMSLDNERDRRVALTSDVEKLSKAAEESRKEAEMQKKILDARETELQRLAKTKGELEKEKAEILRKTLELEKRVSSSESRNIELQKDIVEAASKLEKSALERAELEKKIGDMREADSTSKLKLQAVQEELRRNKEYLETLKTESEQLKMENRAIEIEKRSLSTQLEVATTKTQIYEENLKRAQALVNIEKSEKEKIREHAENLAAGVTELAGAQEKLSQNVRDLRPKTASEIFEKIKQSFVKIVFNYTRKSLLGPSESAIEMSALPVNISGEPWLVFGATDTVLEPTLNKWFAPETLSMSVSGKSYRFNPKKVYSVAEEPRLLAVRIPKEFLEKEKLTPLELSENQFGFSDCVVIDWRKSYYGQSPFRSDFEVPSYAQLDVGLLQSVFGTFSPGAGDYVMSRSGDFLGCMVDSDAAILIKKITPILALALGKDYKKGEAEKFVGSASARLKLLPLRLR